MKIDPSVLTPDRVASPVGDLAFRDGVITPESADAVLDHLLYLRAVDVFLNAYPQVSLRCLIRGVRDFGVADHDVLIFSEMIDCAGLFLTANCDTVYAWSVLDVSAGPVEVIIPENVIAVFDDARFEWIGDGGTPGPDRGLGGRYLVHHRDYAGPLPEGGCFRYVSRTYNVLMLCRAFVERDDPSSAVQRISDQLLIDHYRPAPRRDRHPTRRTVRSLAAPANHPRAGRRGRERRRPRGRVPAAIQRQDGGGKA